MHKRAIFCFCIFFFAESSKANLDEKSTTTLTNTIGSQYLNPYRKELKKIITEYQELETKIKNNPQEQSNLNTQLQDLMSTYELKYRNIEHFIEQRETTLKLFALNEALDGQNSTQLLSPSDYEHNLYIACSPLDKEHDCYKKDEHLLAHLAKHTHLISGYMKWLKTLSMPTTDINDLQSSQKISQELLRNKELFIELKKIVQQIKDQHLEESFLSFWQADSEEKITANAPYITNSRFAPYIQMAYDLKGINAGDATEIKHFVETLDKSTGVINSINITTFIQDACLMMMGITMVMRSINDIKDSAAAIPHDFSYYATTKKLSVLLLPALFPLATWLADKIVNFSLKQRIKKELAALNTLCKKHQFPRAEKTMYNVNTTGTAELTYKTQEEAAQVQTLIEQEMPHCQARIEANNKLIFSLNVQEERAFRFSHPLMQHDVITTKVLPGLLCLLYGKYVTHANFLDWVKVKNPFTQKNIKIPLTKNDIALPIPGFTLLPFHLLKAATTVGMIPVDIYQNFWTMPKKSILSTTQSNELARKTLLDFARMINLVKQLQKLLITNPVMRENFRATEALDVEKGILQKIALYKKLLTQNDAFFKQHQVNQRDVNRAIAGYEKIEKELAKLLDTLEAHTGEKESTNKLVKFFKVRLGSNDLLAAYKIMQSLKDHFAPWFEALGEIDRKISEVSLIKEFEQKNITFCFAQYENLPQPHLRANGLWLPHLLSKKRPEEIVANDIEMGLHTEASTIILSGAVEGGKSTFERTLATANLMAATCGIVPAKHWVSTPLDRILLSFNATDNLSKEESGFRTEVSMIEKIVTQKNNLAPDQKILVIIDELFQKVQRSGEYLSYHVIKDNFINCSNTISLIASHREQPKLLEQEKDAHCRNYHVVLGKANNSMKPTYHIEPGAIFRNQPVVTLEEMLSNQEDAKNLHMVYEAGLIQQAQQINAAHFGS